MNFTLEKDIEHIEKKDKVDEIDTAATAEIRIIIKCFPQVVDRFVTGFSTSIEEDTHFRLKL